MKREGAKRRAGGFNGHFADVNGVRLHYVSEGGGPLILFVHGFPEFWYEWHRQLEHFGADHLAVAVDMRGYNLSSKPESVDDYRVAVLVEDVRQLAAMFTADRFVLVAHDWGGAVAWAFAMQHPSLLRGLVILNAPHPGTFARELRSNQAQQQASAYMTLFRSSQAEELLSANGYAGLVRGILGANATDDEKQAYVEAWSQPGALTGGLNYYRAAALGPPTDDRPDVLDTSLADFVNTKVDVPTLVIWGMQDAALLPSNLDGLEDVVPGVKIVRVGDATHWIVREKPDLVNAEIRAFVASLAT